MIAVHAVYSHISFQSRVLLFVTDVARPVEDGFLMALLGLV